MGLCASKEEPYTKNTHHSVKNTHPSGSGTNTTKVNAKNGNANTGEHSNKLDSLYNKEDINSEPFSSDKTIKNEENSNNVDITKKFNVANQNTKISTSKLMKEDLFQQATSRSGLSMSTSRDMSGLDAPLANLQDNPNLDSTYKVLLLGVGESGKSTVLKQFKILHQGGYSNEELLKIRPIIYKNLVDIANDIIKARDKYKIPVSEADIKDITSINDVDEFRNTLTLNMENNRDRLMDDQEVNSITSLPPIFFAYLAILWKTPATQALIRSKHRNGFHLLENAKYFVDNLERISDPDYLPTVDDILKSRLRTTGIHETVVNMKDENVTLNIYDVGGQRVERKKWIHCFSNVSILIFCVSLSDYDNPLKEDNTVNALTESIQLFDSIVNSKWFANTQVMLFLNKIDIFLQKLPNSPLNTYFPGYKGDPKDAKASVKYILSLLKEKNRANLTIYPHVTQAVDSSNIELVFATIAETVLEKSMKNLGAI